MRDTTETDLQSYTLPANVLGNKWRAIRIRAWGDTAANGNTKTIRLKFGGTTLQLNNTTLAPNGLDWITKPYVVRISSGQQTCSSFMLMSTTPQDAISTAISITDTASIIIKVTGQNRTASAGDITCRGMTRWRCCNVPRGRSNTSCCNTLAAFAKTSTLRLSRPTGGSPVTIGDPGRRGRPRPGYTLLATTADESASSGSAIAAARLDGTNVVVHTTDNAYSYNGTVLTAITGTWATSSATQPVRFCQLCAIRYHHILPRERCEQCPRMGRCRHRLCPDRRHPPASARDICVTGGRVILFRPAATTTASMVRL